MSFLALEGLHVFITGAAGGIGSQAVQEFLGMYVFTTPSLRIVINAYKHAVQIKDATSQPTTTGPVH